MALKNYALTTVQRVADFIDLGTISSGSSKETILQNLINSATDFIEDYVGFRVKQKQHIETYNTNDRQKTLVLNNYPVNSSETFTLQIRNTTSNEDNWTTVDSKYYFVDYDGGIIRGQSGWYFNRSINGYQVTYTAGYNFDNTSTYLSDVEGGAGLELACWMLVASLYERRKAGAGIESEQIGDYSVKYSKSMLENAEIKNILDKYARNDTVGVVTPYQY